MASTSSITPLPSRHPFPPLWLGAVQSTPPTSFFSLSLHQVFTKHHFTSTSCLSLRLCPFPLKHHQPLPTFLVGGGHQPQSMGPWVLSPLPCPVPCLCSEAVCCGSTNARVRRKCMSCHPHVSSGPWLLSDRCGVVCLPRCTFWVELYAVCSSQTLWFKQGHGWFGTVNRLCWWKAYLTRKQMFILSKHVGIVISSFTTLNLLLLPMTFA